MGGNSSLSYFELSWAILSTIGLVNSLHGLVVLGIVGFCSIVFVPITVSAAGALANGLCFYAFYSEHALAGKIAASAVADIAWLVEEAGLSFYSYLVLIAILDWKSRAVFQACYWTLILLIAASKFAILALRVRYLLTSSEGVLMIIGRLHIGYFGGIALVEIVSAALLLKHFKTAFHISAVVSLRGGLFRYLMRSTEIRVALLSLIGISRAITYSFQVTAQSATTLAGQFDRFAATLEIMFPVVMYIDILASRLIFADDVQHNSTSLELRSGTVAKRQWQQSNSSGSINLCDNPSAEEEVALGHRERTGKSHSVPLESELLGAKNACIGLSLTDNLRSS